MGKKSLKTRIHSLCIVLTVFMVVAVLDYVGALQRVEWISYDWRMKEHRADIHAPEDITVILIDETSLANLNPVVGRWPWPRSIHADIIDFLAAGNPKAIVFDILFSENEQAHRQGTPLAENDQRLIDASSNAPSFHAAQLLTDNEDEANPSLINKPLPTFAETFSLPLQTQNSLQLIHNNNTFSFPFPELSNVASGLGIVNLSPDNDGVFRRIPLIHRYQNYVFPSLSISALLDITHKTPLTLNQSHITIHNNNIPIDSKSQHLINFYGHINTYSMSGVIASAQSLLSGDIENLIVDPYSFENKIIFIGGSAAGVEDLKATPISSKTPGVLLHASTAANILTGDFLTPINTLSIYIVNLILIGIAVFTTMRSKRMTVKILIPSSLFVITAATVFWLFAYNIVAPMISPLLSIILAAACTFTYLVFTEGRDKRKVRAMLAQYVSPAVLTEVVDNHQDILHAEIGREENLSVLFSDIRGFTNLSENLPANKLVEILNFYFSKMTDAIFENEGTIDKFIGDAIMAFWGAPIRTDNHALKSVIAAIDMTKRLAEVNQWLHENANPLISIGIGINTGKVIIGNIGSDRKLDYTVIGDNVNLASRLEGLTKPYGCDIIISEYTYNELNGAIPSAIIDTVRVKGKLHPIRVYSPIINTDKEETLKLVALYNSAFQYYLDRNWQAAITTYEKIPNKVLREVFINRCNSYIQEAPAADWDGVHTMTSK